MWAHQNDLQNAVFKIIKCLPIINLYEHSIDESVFIYALNNLIILMIWNIYVYIFQIIITPFFPPPDVLI